MDNIILFGAIQGFALCLYFSFKKKINKRAAAYYSIFLFSLSFFNLVYACKAMGISEIAGIPLASFPFPYKYLIGVGFYFYIKSQISKEENLIAKQEYLLFLPALLYALLRLYWYIILHSGIDEYIFYNVYQSGFFTYNEFASLIFNLVLLYFAIQFLNRNSKRIKGLHKVRKNWNWLLKFTYAFTAINLLNLLHQLIANIAGLQDSAPFYLVLLVINTVYIYWIGLESLTKSHYLFNEFQLKPQKAEVAQVSDSLAQKLDHLIKEEEVFTNKNLKVANLASLLDITEKELSSYIHNAFDMSFSDYINQQRVEKVKQLLDSEDPKKYTLIALAENAGFSSKSSFNAVFKDFTGLTPSQYRAMGKK